MFGHRAGGRFRTVEFPCAQRRAQGWRADCGGLFGDPEIVLGAIQSQAQRDMLPKFEALIAAIVGLPLYETKSLLEGLGYRG